MKKNIRHQTILKLIREGQHNQLLSTRDLAENFDVSEATIRRDLVELSNAGHIHRQYGGALPKTQHIAQDKGEIGLLLGSRIDRYRDPFYNLVLEGADRKIQQLGYRNAYVKTFHDIHTVQQARELITSFPTDGVVILGSNSGDSIQYIREQVANTVTVTDMISREGVELKQDTVMFDGDGGVHNLVDHLVHLGYQRIGFVTGQVDVRYTGFVSAIHKHQLPADPDLMQVVSTGPEGWVPQVGERGAKVLMSLKQPPQAIVCASDRLAIGAMRWLHQHGYHIPHDIAVTGFDNIPDSEFTFPTLTTVHVHKELLGEIAVERIVRQIENPGEVPLRIIVPTSLVVRQSCGSQLR